MGLDMYLEGTVYLYDDAKLMVDGFAMISQSFELGRWRKHYDLNSYILNQFGSGENNSEKIELGIKEMRKIIYDIKYEHILDTFSSYIDEDEDSKEQKKQKDIEIFNKAIDWLKIKPAKNTHRSIYYIASW